MCGIAGIAGTAGISGPEQLAKRMTDALAHRGPDAEGVWCDGDHVVLGHRRLSIIDLSPESNQPFHSSDGRYVIAYNGELYNYRELKRELENEVSGSPLPGRGAGGEVVFRTGSDTEVLLHAYARWGADCLHRFKGMFAFAIWDRELKELFIARDRLGIKPLYLYERDGRLLFASELRALLATGLVPRKLDPDALGDYLRYQTVHAPATIIQGVRMLQPGHWIRYKEGRTQEHCWWDLVSTVDRDVAHAPIEEVRTGIRERLERAVERRMVSDVPFGAFLSGGIDSSVVVGLMAQVSTAPVHTFSIVFDEEEFSEEKYARMVAEKFRTEHTVVRLRPDDMLRQLPDILASMDHPSGDGPNMYMVSQATKNGGITMALSGLGSDELFAGYTVFQRAMEMRKHGWLAAMPAVLRRPAASLLSRFGSSAEHQRMALAMQLGSVEVDRLYPMLRRVAPDQRLGKLLRSHALPPDRTAIIGHDLLRSRKGIELPVLSRISLLEISTYMQNILLRDTDQMSMAHALEVRVPFLDHELVQYVLGVSDTHKFPHTTKQLLTSSVGDLLPREIIDRPKMGFTLPWARWMHEELRGFCEERIERLAERAVIDGPALRTMWHSFQAGNKKIHWSQFWHLVVLEDWMERNGVDV